MDIPGIVLAAEVLLDDPCRLRGVGPALQTAEIDLPGLRVVDDERLGVAQPRLPLNEQRGELADEAGVLRVGQERDAQREFRRTMRA